MVCLYGIGGNGSRCQNIPCCINRKGRGGRSTRTYILFQRTDRRFLVLNSCAQSVYFCTQLFYGTTPNKEQRVGIKIIESSFLCISWIEFGRIGTDHIRSKIFHILSDNTNPMSSLYCPA